MDFLAQLNSKITRKAASDRQLAQTLGVSVKQLAASNIRRRKVDEALMTRLVDGKEVRV